MPFKIIWAIIFLGKLCWAQQPAQPTATEKSRIKIRYFEGASPKRELLEGGAMLGLLGVDLWFKTQRAWFSTPWLPTKFESESNDPVSEDLVPAQVLNIAVALPNLFILMLPNEEGFFSPKAWRHSKGYAEAVFILTPLMTDFVKLCVGKKRPNYKALTADGASPVGARKAFWSLHSATAFGAASYANFYLLQHLGDGLKDDLIWKIPTIATAYGLATLVAITRDYNQDHDDYDIFVGGLFGSLMAAGVYAAQEGLWLNLYPKTAKTSLTPIPNGLMLSFRF